MGSYQLSPAKTSNYLVFSAKILMINVGLNITVNTIITKGVRQASPVP